MSHCSIDFDWYDIHQESYEEVQITSSDLGSFELRDDLTYDVCQCYTFPADSEPIVQHILQVYAHMKLFKQIQACCHYPLFNELAQGVSYLPERIDTLLSGIGDVKLKQGTYQMKWSLTTLKTALLNQSFFYHKVKTVCISTDYPFPLFIEPEHECYKGLFWDDDEGNDKLDTYIRSYLDKFSGKVVSQNDCKKFVIGIPSDKSLSITEANLYLPPWFKSEHPEFMHVYSLFMLDRLQRTTQLTEMNESTQTALRCIGLTFCNITVDQLTSSLSGIDTLYEIGGYKSVGLVNTPGSGQGCLGQLFMRNVLDLALTPLSECSQFSKAFGYVLTPARQIDMNAKFIVNGDGDIVAKRLLLENQ
ncbi:hypothetical protein JA1_003286 [Spathaspora sp. JA1]|nr:hypothetical protein JA1_003286 [Spathaspora sp. JA1]